MRFRGAMVLSTVVRYWCRFWRACVLWTERVGHCPYATQRPVFHVARDLQRRHTPVSYHLKYIYVSRAPDVSRRSGLQPGYSRSVGADSSCGSTHLCVRRARVLCQPSGERPSLGFGSCAGSAGGVGDGRAASGGCTLWVSALHKTGWYCDVGELGGWPHHPLTYFASHFALRC